MPTAGMGRSGIISLLLVQNPSETHFAIPQAVRFAGSIVLGACQPTGDSGRATKNLKRITHWGSASPPGVRRIALLRDGAIDDGNLCRRER